MNWPHMCPDVPFINHFRATVSPAKIVLMYEIAFNMMVVIKSLFNANHLLAIFKFDNNKPNIFIWPISAWAYRLNGVR